MLAEYESKDKETLFCFDSVRKSTDSGFCLMGKILFDEYCLLKSLIELYNKSTINIGGYYIFKYNFRNNKERIAALKKCIEETHPDNNQKTKLC